jgi:geranylgeranyl transferase type-2 subunit beta
MLTEGVSRLGSEFADRHAAAVLARQAPDGGFPGRQGASDLYYNRFALEALTILGATDSAAEAMARCAEFVALSAADVQSPGQWLNFLHSAQLLRAAGHEIFCCDEFRAGVHDRAAAALEQCRDVSGGYAVRPGGQAGPYHTFLAALCYELIDRPMPDVDRAADSCLACRAADGGFAEAAGRDRGQANPSAAAVAVLTIAGRLEDRTAEDVAAFIGALQTAEGGLKAHAGVPGADLLSTFTGLTTLTALDAVRRIQLGRLGRYVRSLSLPGGGFAAAAGDNDTDVEYTFYGIAALAALAQIVAD